MMINSLCLLNNNNNRRLVTLAEHTSDHGRQTNSSTEDYVCLVRAYGIKLLTSFGGGYPSRVLELGRLW